jgi:hypothetical protein
MPEVSQFLRVYCKTYTRRSDVRHPQHIQYTMRIVTLRVPGWVYCVTEVSRVVSPRQLGQVEALTTTVSYLLQAETVRHRDSNKLYGDEGSFIPAPEAT